uniref:Uncharacterized protein n=1 Tax=Meloidogyne enterolobii TaxID=390850 RepID=A0A6V7V814_MELEN|nr:unnamed protein product [Meloidogyne enterolobii]CAD2171127.1 unnamed protein product [Meloidogyne enterolobii]
MTFYDNNLNKFNIFTKKDGSILRNFYIYFIYINHHHIEATCVALNFE